MPKQAFIVGIGDDQGYAWAIAKALVETGTKVHLGIWPPMYSLFCRAWQSGKFDTSRKLGDGTLWEYESIYPIDVQYDTYDDVPQEVRENKRYEGLTDYTLSGVAQKLQHIPLDHIVHAVGYAPEITKPLLDTSRSGYLTALNASAYSLIALARYFGPQMRQEGALLNLSFQASNKVVPGYGGGMSAAKAALESDTRTLAYEMGRMYGIRVNSISAGPLRSRSARAIGNIDAMIEHTQATSPLQTPLEAKEVGSVARFLLSEEASGITGAVIPVDKGYSIMGALSANEVASLEPASMHR